MRLMPWIPGLIMLVPMIVFSFIMILGLSGRYDPEVWWHAVYSVAMGMGFMFFLRYTVGRRIRARIKPRIRRLHALQEKINNNRTEKTAGDDV